MRIRRWDWDNQNYVIDDYPDEKFEKFLNWILRTKLWLEHPDMVVEHVRSLDKELMEYRTPANTHREAEVVLAEMSAPIDLGLPTVEADLPEIPNLPTDEQVALAEMALAEKYRLAAIKRKATIQKKREAAEKRKAKRLAKEALHAEG